MALDPRLLLAGRVPSLRDAITGGLEIGRQVREQPLREALMKAQVEQAQAQALRGPSVSPLQRGQGVVTQQDGSSFIQTPVFNPNTGGVDVVSSPIQGTLTSRVGETPQQLLERRVEQERQVSNIRVDQRAEEEKIATNVAASQASERARGAGAEKRRQEDIGSGVVASRGLPITRRAIELMDSVETGGFAAAQNAAAVRFGIQAADEGELSNLLGKQVLSQLRDTFGAAFTESEGQRLIDLEAGFGKSPAANRRILAQAEKLASTAANRGLRAAVDAKDFRTAQEIQEMLDFTLAPPAQQQQNIQELSDDDLLSF